MINTSGKTARKFTSDPYSTDEASLSSTGYTWLTEEDYRFLQKRLDPLHVDLRLRTEADHESKVLARGERYFRSIENWAPSRLVIETCLKLTGLYRRGRRNAAQIDVRHHCVNSPLIPQSFHGYTILHLSDLHIEMSKDAMARLVEVLKNIRYDLCVLTGDYRGQDCGPYDTTLASMSDICGHFKKPVYGVLGNYDTVCMLRGLEEMGIRMLINENETIENNGQCIYLAGVDDAHFYRADNIEKAASGIPNGEFSILLSHTPEIYRQAARADFNVLLAGHTHGGQICLPGKIAITLGSVLPRHMAAGTWKYRNLIGYTSVGVGSCVAPVRFNCPRRSRCTICNVVEYVGVRQLGRWDSIVARLARRNGRNRRMRLRPVQRG